MGWQPVLNGLGFNIIISNILVVWLRLKPDRLPAIKTFGGSPCIRSIKKNPSGGGVG